jgi:uncharacterized protein (TIGR02147 family)
MLFSEMETHDHAEEVREALRQELLKRCQTQPRYSMRMFARALNIDPSLLSKVINGRRRPSSRLCSMVRKTLPQVPLDEKFQKLAADHIQIIAEWHHCALFELLAIEPGASTKGLAARLGISEVQVKDSLERLERLNLVQQQVDKTWKRLATDITSVGNDFSTTAFQKWQADLLQKAIDALTNIPYERRDQSSLTVSMRKDRLEEVKQKIKKFRRELCMDLEKDQDRDSVYQLVISFYPLTQT